MTRVLPADVAAYRLGLVFVAAALAMSFAAAVGLPANITVATIGLGTIYLATQPALVATVLATWGASHVALGMFVLLALASLGLSLGRIASLPVEYFLHAIALVVLCPVAYLLGSVVMSHATSAGVARIFRLALASVVAFVAVIWLAPELLSDNEIAKGSYYQYLGDCLAMLALLHLSTRRAGMSVLPILVVIPVLVMVGSRASVVAFVAALTVSSLLPVLLVSGLVLLLAWPWIESVLLVVAPDLFEISRVVTTLAGALLEGREDASLLERQGFQRTAFELLGEHPLRGGFGYDYFANGFVGGFSHSAVDVWAQYGLPAFLAFVGAVVATPLLTLMTSTVRGSMVRTVTVVAPPLVFLCLEFMLFRHPESVVLFFGAGALAGLAARRAAGS